MPKATHRVKDSSNNMIGYVIDRCFYTDYYVKENIGLIDNLSCDAQYRIVGSDELPELDYKTHIVGMKYRLICEENPFVRDIQEELHRWKQDNFHQVLQLEGARQIGKTTELLKFAYQNYEYTVYVNLASDPYHFLEVVQNGCTPIEMEKYCRRAKLPHFVNGQNTILVIDEIQQDSAVYNAIRTLNGNLACDVAVTGSYLGRILGEKDFFLPAGTIYSCRMFPLSFLEFSRVFGKENSLKQLDLFGKSSLREYEALQQLYQIYVQIGGYPEAVKRYKATENIDACYGVIGRLLDTFKEESRNYFTSPREVEIFDIVYREAFQEMCSEKKGSGKNIVEKITSLVKAGTDVIVSKREISNAVVWLKYTGILGTCSLANEGNIRNIIPDRRLYYMDCGIASYIGKKYTMEPSAVTGLLAETFVYNELHRLFGVPFGERKVKEDEVCFSVFHSYELDFMITDRENTVYGIEVKAKDGEPQSLKVFIDKKFVDKGIVLKQTKGGRSALFDTIPIYAAGCRFPYCLDEGQME